MSEGQPADSEGSEQGRRGIERYRQSDGSYRIPGLTDGPSDSIYIIEWTESRIASIQDLEIRDSMRPGFYVYPLLGKASFLLCFKSFEAAKRGLRDYACGILQGKVRELSEEMGRLTPVLDGLRDLGESRSRITPADEEQDARDHNYRQSGSPGLSASQLIFLMGFD